MKPGTKALMRRHKKINMQFGAVKGEPGLRKMMTTIRRHDRRTDKNRGQR